jgi:prevent-host-death family protein
MLKVSSTEVQNNFGKYLLLANEQDIIVTRNGQEVACLSGLNARKGGSSMVSEKALAEGYGLHKASYEEFLELTKGSEERYEFIDGEIFLQASPKADHQLAQMVLAGTFFNHFDGQNCVPMSAPFDITIRRSEDDVNVVQPDLMVICDLLENLGEDGYYYGVPTLVAEILSESTRRNDLLKKLNLYMTGGVPRRCAGILGG